MKKQTIQYATIGFVGIAGVLAFYNNRSEFKSVTSMIPYMG